MLNSTAWSDTDAKTFLELVVFPFGSPAPLSPLLVFSVFPPFHPLVLLNVIVKERVRREGRCVSMSQCVFICLRAQCLCIDCSKEGYLFVNSASNALFIVVLPAE